MNDQSNPFSALAEYGERADTERNKKGQFVKGHTIHSGVLPRQKGEPQTLNMNFVARLNWLLKRISSISGLHATVNELRRHRARVNLSTEDERKLQAFEMRVIKLQDDAQVLWKEIAAWNKKKKMNRIVE